MSAFATANEFSAPGGSRIYDAKELASALAAFQAAFFSVLGFIVHLTFAPLKIRKSHPPALGSRSGVRSEKDSPLI